MRDEGKRWFYWSKCVKKMKLLIHLASFFSRIGSLPSPDDIIAAVDSASSYVPRFVIQSALVVP